MQTTQGLTANCPPKRWQKLAAAGAQAQRLLWASTGTKDPAAPDTLYIEALAAPDTINTMPEKTLLAFADHGQLRQALPFDGGDAAAVPADCRQRRYRRRRAGGHAQREGADAFVKSWHQLLEGIAAKTAQLARASTR